MIRSAILMGLFCAGTVQATSYSTNFPLTENPISENGNWASGQSAGNNLWGDVQTNGTMAYGVSEPTPYGDPTAILKGSWGRDQTVQATVKINATPTGTCCHEAEVRLRTAINPTAHTLTGYEVYCSVNTSAPYCHIASWGGPNGAWVNMENSPPALVLKNGDVLKATVTGTNPVTITAYINGKQIMSVQDAGNFTFSDGRKYGPWTGGAPGIGFYDNQDNNWNRFGFSTFSASDSIGSGAAEAFTTKGLRSGPVLYTAYNLNGQAVHKFNGEYSGHADFTRIASAEKRMPSGLYVWTLSQGAARHMVRKVAIR